MGLDIVELVMRCEEEFKIDLPDWKLEHMRTVGNLFELICERLNLPFGGEELRPNRRIAVPLVASPRSGWTRDSVWCKVVNVCADQLQVPPEDVRNDADFVYDLGVG